MPKPNEHGRLEQRVDASIDDWWQRHAGELAEGLLGCGTCGGPLVLLGKLGKVEWYRCRNCGAEVGVED